MAIKSSFKQQCPSCEAMVPVRDPKLIGRKIDCPKCKYRFVVEEPVDEVEEVEEDAPKKGKSGSNGITAKKAANGKAPAKPALKRRADDDEDEEIEQPKKKKSGGSGMLIAGIGLAAIAVVALAVGAVFLFSGDKEDKKATGGGGGSTTPAGGAANNAPSKAPETKKDELKPRQEDVTNLLPNDSQAVVNLPMENLHDNSRLWNAIFKTPGSFQESAFQRVWGITPAEIRRVVLAANVEKKTTFAVMRTSAPLDEAQIVAGLKLKPLVDKDSGMKYYLVARALDALSTFLLKSGEYHDKLALHFVDPFTVVCADLGPMQQFLKDKGQPKQLTQQPVETPRGGTQGGPRGGMPGAPPGMPGAPPGGMQGGSRPPPGGPQPGGGPQRPPAPAAPGGGSQPPAGAPQPGGGPQMPPAPGAQGGQPGRPPSAPGGFQPPTSNMPPGMMAPGMRSGGSQSDAAPMSSSYMTVNPHLKAVLDQAEKTVKDEEQIVLLSIAQLNSVANVEGSSPFGGLQKIGTLGALLSAISQLEHFKDSKASGLAFVAFSDKKSSLNVAWSTDDANAVLDMKKELQVALEKTYGQQDFVSKNTDNRSGMPGGMRGGMPGGLPQPNPGGFPQPNPGGFPQPNPGGFPQPNPGGFPQPNPGGFPQPGRGGVPQPGGEEKKEEKGKGGDYLVWTKDKAAAFNLNMKLKTGESLLYQVVVGELCKRQRAESDLCDRRSRIHELAAATQAFFQREGHFPRGAMPRSPNSERVIDWRPDQRLSWMVELLPDLGNGEYKNLHPKIDASWSDGPDNLQIAATVIPQFLAPKPGDKIDNAYLLYPGIPPLPVAATHFVGVAGLGLDAAEYHGDDAATAKRRGIFGYDRETKKDDIKDGLEQTIAVIQVPPAPKAPWLAGGGGTVRGVSEDLDCVRPFVCTEYQGKRGTFAIMADGKVRFIPETIDPKTFQALCTIAGGEKIKNLDDIAPEVPPPEEGSQQKELKAEQPAPVAANPPQGGNAVQSQDLQQLQGTWTQVGGEIQGKPMPPDMVQKMVLRLVVTGDNFTMTWNNDGPGDKEERGTLKLDETKSPKELDAQVTFGSLQGKTKLCVYSVSAAELKLCMSNPDKPRPTAFATKPGVSGTILFVFKRANP